ncbi:uncharacterized protein LOC133302446 isoform X1 [Gastrolobium bilobum]|uniref:uncharacterized protein LOC133302446 isoform X1 n=1 Tax=Gastrolobium bilobum TaxID=150636 RepID=UPI002AB16ADE|nr:uncharacterized protein LOC133302446 isoform X1 [Gastrolobium bilobum]
MDVTFQESESFFQGPYLQGENNSSENSSPSFFEFESLVSTPLPVSVSPPLVPVPSMSDPSMTDPPVTDTSKSDPPLIDSSVTDTSSTPEIRKIVTPELVYQRRKQPTLTHQQPQSSEPLGEHHNWCTRRKGDAFRIAYCGRYLLLLLWSNNWLEI